MNREETGRRVGVEGVAMMLPAHRLDDFDRDSGLPWQPTAPFALEAPHLLSGVAAASPTEVWAVGHAGGRPLIARWDGTGWSIQNSLPIAAALIGAGLGGVATGTDPTGAIAVGGGFDRLLNTEVPLIQHWDGSTWSRSNAPDLTGQDGDGGARGYVLTDVTFAGPGEAWAVGHGFPRGREAPGLVALHWTDDNWQAADAPAIAKGKLLAVSGTSPQDVWAVGAASRAGLIVHYDGDGWRQVPCPSTRFPLSDVTAVSPAEAWCVGGDSVLRWNGRKWTKVNVPIDSANTVTAAPTGEVWVGGGRGELAHFDGKGWQRVDSPGNLSGTAVWLASAATYETSDRTTVDGTIWMVGSQQFSGSAATDHQRTITAQSGEN